MSVHHYFVIQFVIRCTKVPVALPGGGKNTNSRFFVRCVPLFRSLMLTPMHTHTIRFEKEIRFMVLIPDDLDDVVIDILSRHCSP